MLFKEYYFKESAIRGHSFLLSESAGFGHLNHIWEDKDLTFSDLKDIIKKSILGTLSNIYEKSDGQNLLLSYKDDEVKFARNKSQIKVPINALGILEMFKNHDRNVKDVFVNASNDLNKVMSDIDTEYLNDLFYNGNNFISLEIINENTINVIPYHKNVLIPHCLISYDKSGTPIKYEREPANELFKKFGKMDHFKIEIQKEIKLNKIPNAEKIIQQFINELNEIKDDLDDNDTIQDYINSNKDIAWLNALFLRLGTIILKDVGNLVDNKEKAKLEIKNRLLEKIKEVEKGNDKEAIDKLNIEMNRLKLVDWQNNIPSTEGIIFIYNGKQYKLTGIFSPINFILGINKYNR